MKVVLAWTDSTIWQCICDSDVKCGTAARVSQEVNYLMKVACRSAGNPPQTCLSQVVSLKSWVCLWLMNDRYTNFSRASRCVLLTSSLWILDCTRQAWQPWPSAFPFHAHFQPFRFPLSCPHVPSGPDKPSTYINIRGNGETCERL